MWRIVRTFAQPSKGATWLALLLLACACAQPQKQRRGGPQSGKNDLTVKPCPTGQNCDKPSADGNGSNGGPAAGPGTDGEDTDATGDELRDDDAPAPYLLTSKAAAGMTPAVKRFEEPPYEKSSESSDPAFSALRNYLEGYLNKVMKLSALSPGRKVEVFVERDEAMNAAADGFQRVFVNTGSIKGFDAAGMHAVLCHELAHSARNHQISLFELETSNALKSKMDRFYQEVDTYFSAQFNTQTNTYTHDKRAYDAIRKLWDAVEPQLSRASKLYESEADFIGGIICGQAGMDATTFAAALTKALNDIEKQAGGGGGEGISANDLRDGERFQLGQFELFSFLFPRDSHPTNQERSKQLARLKKVYAKAFDDKQRLFAQWRTEYVTEAGGLALTAAADPLPPPVVTTGGRILKLPKKGCSHR